MKLSTIGLKHAALAVHNLPRALDFYTQHLDAKPYHVQDQDWAMVLVGHTSVSLVPYDSHPTPTRQAGRHPAHLGFVVSEPSEVQLWHKRLSLVPGIQAAPVVEHRDGSTGFYFSDTEGNALELIAIPLHSRAHPPIEQLWCVLPDPLASSQSWCESLTRAVAYHTHGQRLNIVSASAFRADLGFVSPYRIVPWSKTEAKIVMEAGLGQFMKEVLMEDPSLVELFAARLVL
jgi:catechol 2,3-dioxygenase-like lactoylglutathione lyase family enzyme